jgi:uncharacterized Zn-finger protein
LKDDAIAVEDTSDEDEDDPHRKHKCPTCNKGFLRPHHLRRHMDTHENNPETHKCTLCPSSFARDDNLLRHMREVHKE